MNFVLGLAKAAMYIAYRPKVIYKDKSLKKELKNKPCVFVANHTCHTDGIFAVAVLGKYKPYSLVAKDWYDKKFMGFFLKHSRTVPIDRFNPDADWYLLCQRVIEKGNPMVIFPEGKTNHGGELNEFKPGAALLAEKMSVPVIPCAIYGGYHKLIGKRQRMVVGEAVEMHCPDDIRPSRYAKEQTVIIQNKVQSLLDENIQ